MEPKTNLAQRSNFWPLTVWGYDLWRTKSLSWMTGQPFPLEKEFQLFLSWVDPVSGQQWLDVGTSTGNYARVLVQAGATVTAMDLSEGFLKRLPRHPRLQPVQGNMEAGIFDSGTFDGVVVAGTLNETHAWQDMLVQSSRVLKRDGRLFLMYLLPSASFFGRVLQGLIKKTGIAFIERNTVRTYLRLQGLAIKKEKRCGIVCFELFVKEVGV